MWRRRLQRALGMRASRKQGLATGPIVLRSLRLGISESWMRRRLTSRFTSISGRVGRCMSILLGSESTGTCKRGNVSSQSRAAEAAAGMLRTASSMVAFPGTSLRKIDKRRRYSSSSESAWNRCPHLLHRPLVGNRLVGRHPATSSPVPRPCDGTGRYGPAVARGVSFTVLRRFFSDAPLICFAC